MQDVRLEARGRGDRLRDLIPREREVGGQVEALTDSVRVPDQPGEPARDVGVVRQRPERGAVVVDDHLLPAPHPVDDRVPLAGGGGGNPRLAVGVCRSHDRRREIRFAAEEILTCDLVGRVLPARVPERRIFEQRAKRRRLSIDGRRADEHVLGDVSGEELDVRRDMLGRERDPIDDDVEALVAQRGRDRRRIANVGMDRTHAARGVGPSPVEQREVDAALGEQLRDRERDVAGAADRENAHVHDVIVVGQFTKVLGMNAIPAIKLNDGHTIPQLGFGVFQVPPPETEAATTTALSAGYRHIDTAEMYGNEGGVGDAVRAAGLDRSEVYVTSKLNNGFHEPDAARRAFDETLATLGFDYVDLFLIHWPLPTLYDGDFVSTWKTLEEFKQDGRARSIGVSNFQIPHLERLAAESDVVPAVNQVELHPYFQNREVDEYGKAHGIVTEAWAPIAQGKVLGDPTLTEIAGRIGKSVAQVVLRWHIQHGNVVFPKSVTPERIRENIQIFDFELGPADLATIDGLDRGEAGREGPNPDSFAYVPG